MSDDFTDLAQLAKEIQMEALCEELQTTEAEVAALRAEVAALRAQLDELDSFDGVVALARSILDNAYPPTIFTGESGDEGTVFVATFRKLLERVSALSAGGDNGGSG